MTQDGSLDSSLTLLLGSPPSRDDDLCVDIVDWSDYSTCALKSGFLFGNISDDKIPDPHRAKLDDTAFCKTQACRNVVRQLSDADEFGACFGAAEGTDTAKFAVVSGGVNYLDCSAYIYDATSVGDQVIDAPNAMRGLCPGDWKDLVNATALNNCIGDASDWFSTDANLTAFCASADCLSVTFDLLAAGELGCVRGEEVLIYNGDYVRCQDYPSPTPAMPVSPTLAPTPTTADNSSGDGANSHGGLSTGAVIGITAAGFMGCLLVIVLIYRCLKTRRAAKSMAATVIDSPESQAHAYHYYPGESATHSSGTCGSQRYSAGSRSGGSLWEDPAIVAVRIPFELLTFGTLISSGAYGEVYLGVYRNKSVAIKTLIPKRRKDMKQIGALLAEAKLMASMDHPCIVKFIGVAWGSLSETSIVIEYMARGDLRSALDAFGNPKSTGTRARGFDVHKVRIALHVVNALTYMHSLQPVVLHRDLKSRNVLLDDELNAKVTDFGTSRERADQTMTAGIGSNLWMAPEVMTGQRYDQKADIFSFGVVLSELDTHTMPYTGATEPGTNQRLASTAILQLVTSGKLQVAFTPSQDDTMAALGRECVSVDPKARPTAAQALHRVLTLHKSMVSAGEPASSQCENEGD